MKLKATLTKEITQELLIRILIERTKNWNGGAGLILPQNIAKILRKMGIIKGFTEDKPMTITNHLKNAKR